MSVVLRCPNCGTTQTAVGECEACHEAQVRYFCMDHDPGRWLTGPACPACEARRAPTAAAAAPPPAVETHLPVGDNARRHRPRVDERTPGGAPSGHAAGEPRVRGIVESRGAVPVPRRSERAPVTVGRAEGASGWLLRLALRLTVIAVVLVVALVGVVYCVARSLP